MSDTETKLTGIKHDQDKPRMSLLSPIALRKIAQVMTFGAKKYSDNNWRGGFKFTRLLDAVERHLNHYQSGETFDNETGLSHLSHAACGLMMLLEFEETKPELDDRYFKMKPLPPPLTEDEAKLIQELLNEKSST